MPFDSQVHKQLTVRPAVSAIVPCRNEAAVVETCLRSILAQVEPQGGFEVIVADGMSDDGTREILARLAASDPRLKVVDNPLRTTPCGMNCGIRAARGEWIAIMGSHNRYAADYLARCLDAAQATGADNVGGAMFAEGDSLVQRAIAAAHHSPFSVGGARWHNPQYEGPADTVFGGFYRREVFYRIGFFDESLVRNQDDEFNLRLTRAGGKIWQSPSIKSWYRPRSSISALFRQYKQYGYWKVPVIRKHRLPASWRHLVPGTFVLTLGVLLAASVPGLLFSGGWVAEVGRFSAMVLALILTVYAVALAVAAVAAGRQSGWSLIPVLPVIFACYHLSYGFGFLRGIWDFGIWRSAPGEEFLQLTRQSARPDCEKGPSWNSST